MYNIIDVLFTQHRQIEPKKVCYSYQLVVPQGQFQVWGGTFWWPPTAPTIVNLAPLPLPTSLLFFAPLLLSLLIGKGCGGGTNCNGNATGGSVCDGGGDGRGCNGNSVMGCIEILGQHFLKHQSTHVWGPQPKLAMCWQHQPHQLSDYEWVTAFIVKSPWCRGSFAVCPGWSLQSYVSTIRVCQI